jgi:hypothetical protein
MRRFIEHRHPAPFRTFQTNSISDPHGKLSNGTLEIDTPLDVICLHP